MDLRPFDRFQERLGLAARADLAADGADFIRVRGDQLTNWVSSGGCLGILMARAFTGPLATMVPP